MHPGAEDLVTKLCNQSCRPLSALVCISDSAPAISYGRRIANGAVVVHVAGSLRALPFAGEARFQDAALRSPSTPLPKNQANAPMRSPAHGSFPACERPRGGVPRLSAANKKEKFRVKIESSVPPIFRTQLEGGRHVC